MLKFYIVKFLLFILVFEVSAMAELPEKEIRSWVRTGFYDQDELMEIFTEELYEPGELDEDQVRHIIETELAKIKTEQKSWPAVTDVDKLEEVFEQLNQSGVIALHNAGYTQSDGHSDVSEAYQELENKSKILGYCFYHGQDLERAVLGEGLFLTFGTIDPNADKQVALKVGNEIVTALEKKGFKTKWDGTLTERILITKIDWKKRIE